MLVILVYKTEYYQKSYPRPATTDLGTRFAPKFDWNHSELRDHNNGNLLTIGGTSGDPSSGCAFLVYFPGGRTASQVSYYSGSTGTVSFYSDFWGSNDGVSWEHLETVEPYTNGSSPAPVGSSKGKLYEYFAYARNDNGDTQKSDSSNINTYYGFNLSSNYRVSPYEGPEVLLTFTDSTDLEYFQAGDVLQQSAFVYPFQTTDLSNSSGGVVTTPSNAYDGDLTKGALGGGATTWVQFNLDPYGINVKTGDVVTVYLRNEFLIGNTGNIGDTILKFVDGSEITGTGVSGTDPVEHIDLIVDGQKTIQYIKHYTTNSNTRQPAISGIALNGMLLLGEDYKDKADLVSVVSVDDPNSQMVVDGGEWTAVDDSQTWSDPPVFEDNGYGPQDAFVITNAFDGDINSRALPTQGGTWTLNFGSLFTNIQEVEFEVVAKGTSSILVNNQGYSPAGTTTLTVQVASLK